MVFLNETAKEMLIMVGLFLSSFSTFELGRKRNDKLISWVAGIAMVIFGLFAILSALSLLKIV